MASATSHRVRAVVSAVVDGLVVGSAEAALELPARSWARARVYLAIGAAVTGETVVRELPTLRRALRGLPPLPDEPYDQTARLAQALVTTGWGLVATVLDGPVSRELSRRGHAHPHLLLGLVVGVATAVSAAPVWWRRATARIAQDRSTAGLDDELAELLEQMRD
ncbi:hypothetical protein SAMN06893096_104399 [Geodermatophilus pulveris]|uniref:Uncharacterized protein n=1 Tax=Geodermatophilus pulveris TaxID=1564159 RepID=A0A239F1B1_9ACTN|nr:hypothetical protein [Geodermatophilus pulveris]SNS50328.1 hypothetical protein SAMN06893096_104399 [Geodermatophilus pulveris]